MGYCDEGTTRNTCNVKNLNTADGISRVYI